jgi:hypothetical protein
MHPQRFHNFFAAALAIALIGLNPVSQAIAQAPPETPPEAPEGVRIDADGVPRFDGIKEVRTRPDGAPEADLVERPAALLERATLPAPPTEEALRALAAIVAPRTVELVALVMPPQPYRQVPMIYRGHAVWISSKADGGDPILVSSLDWLEGAESIYIIPEDPSLRRALPTASIVSLDELTAGGLDMEVFEAKKHRLSRLKLAATDKWRGLARLAHDGGPALKPPVSGLTILDLQKDQLGLTYGYSLAASAAPVTTALLPPPADDDPSLQFFFRSPFPAILGAPLVDLQGRLVGLTALRHPGQPRVTLVIPPAACAAFARAQQADPAKP